MFLLKKSLKSEILFIGKVAKIVEKGKIVRFKVIVATGNYKNIIGLGIGKDANFHIAKQKAIEDSYKNLIIVKHFVREGIKTIPRKFLIKLKKTKIIFKPNDKKTGLRASKLLFVLAKLAGFNQLLVKCITSRNTLNSIYAFFEFLSELNKYHK